MHKESQALDRVQQLEEELNRYRYIQDQVAGITNDLNNLIAAMKGQAQLACEIATEQEKDELIRVVLSASLKAEGIIERLHLHALPPSPATKVVPPPNGDLASILIADDEHTMRNLLSRILQNSGYQVKMASSGAEAMEMSRQEKFDLAFLDFQLGDMKGTDVFQALQAYSPSTHVIFMSGDPNAEEETMQTVQGPRTFIKKPFDVTVVKQKVSYILTMRSALTCTL
jgi:CheY-like chemotaxis protein